MKSFIAVACLLVAVSAQTTQYPLRAYFDAFDKNGDGFIELGELNALYDSFDTNKDGKVDLNEFLANYPAATGTSVEGSGYIFFLLDKNEDGVLDAAERTALFNSFDANADGKVTFGEYSALRMYVAAQLQYVKASGVKLTAIFNKADANGDGKLSPAELNSVFVSADKNGDGKVSKDEFVTMWMAETGESAARSELMFGFLDTDKDGYYGSAQERAAALAAFDDNGDGFVTKDEYDFLFLFLGARLQRIKDAAAAGF